MALFGASDEYVPLLTAFYQAEPDKEKPIGSELDILLFRYTRNIPHCMKEWSDLYPLADAEIREYVAKALTTVTATHAVMVRLMDAVADNTIPSEADLQQFNKMARAILTPPQLAYTGSPAFGEVKNDGGFYTSIPKQGAGDLFLLTPRFGENQSKEIELGKGGIVVQFPIPKGGDDTDFPDVTEFLAEVLTEFVKAFERNAFVRCEECGSVFAVTRRGQRFCSQRDANRVAQRRGRQRKAEKELAMSGGQFLTRFVQ